MLLIKSAELCCLTLRRAAAAFYCKWWLNDANHISPSSHLFSSFAWRPESDPLNALWFSRRDWALQVGWPRGSGLWAKGRVWLVYWDGWRWVGLHMASTPKMFSIEDAEPSWGLKVAGGIEAGAGWWPQCCDTLSFVAPHHSPLALPSPTSARIIHKKSHSHEFPKPVLRVREDHASPGASRSQTTAAPS